MEDMPPPPLLPPGAERTRRLRMLWGGWSRVLPPLDLRGVRRYRNIEEAARDREAAVIRRARRIQADRSLGSPEPPAGTQVGGPNRSDDETSRTGREAA